MSLRFYFGPSGSGKSTQVYKEILERARADLRKNFLVIVPDQFTMQTQKELVTMSAQGGIMNIDVLSFGRLGHRILEEVGWNHVPVLDDTGKCLVLQRVAAGLEDELPVLGSLLKRQGYIHEAKSAISEFMQYGISVEDVSGLISFAEGRGALAKKLQDLQVLYQGFQEYIQGNFITTEEKLDVLARSLGRSKLLPESVVVFDGFTGFTPIQNRLIQRLMGICEEVIVTITLGEGENPYQLDGEQKLFHLSKKTVADLQRLAEGIQVPMGQDVYMGRTPGRFAQSEALAHLERNLFRYPVKPFDGKQIKADQGEAALGQICMFEALSPREEVQQTGLEIRRLIREKDLLYRDIALVIGDLESYAPYVETEFGELGIPCFLDRTRGIVLNPMIEYIKSALALYVQDFSYESVFHFLRSGLCDLAQDDIDLLENYCIQTGVRGRKKWSKLFTRKTKQMKEDETQLAHLNEIRQAFYEQVEMLQIQGKTAAKSKSSVKTENTAKEEVVAKEETAAKKRAVKGKATAKEYVEKLYAFLENGQVQQKLDRFAAQFEAANELSRAKEYEQIYRLVMELLEQVYELLGEEQITLTEFQEILEAGFGEIEVGMIPQNVDRVIVGDMERTRLKQVKVLFFLGVNDGNIPRNASKGGIISDMDREFLRESGLELAPSPRQQMYIQRLYLYLNMTKPSERLYLSYAKVNSAGKSMRPAYLIEVVQNLFPGLKVDCPQNTPVLEQICTPTQGRAFLAKELREYAAGSIQAGSDAERDFFTLYQVYGKIEDGRDREQLTRAAFARYQDSGLSRLVAQLLYGKTLQNSVSRLETFAACAYRHFLQYGLSLQEREEFGFEAVDMGNVYHAVLQSFGSSLKEKGYTWFDFPKEFAGEAVQEALEAFAAQYGDTVLYSSARNAYAITRMGRVLTRTVLTLQKQLQKGKFVPDSYELSFGFADDLASVRIALSDEERMHLVGKIDRLDVAQDEEHVYVKVVDYKSGKKDFDLVALYYGLQLQLVVYMNAAMEKEAREHPDKDVVPAAMLYYHIEDPTVEAAEEMTAEELEEKLLVALKTKGVVNADPNVVGKLDTTMEKASEVIPVTKNKDGGFTKTSSVMTREQFKIISDYAGKKIVEIGRQMMDGCVSVNPYERGDEDSCQYCSYKNVCGFDPSIPGYRKRNLEEEEQEELLRRMAGKNGGTETENGTEVANEADAGNGTEVVNEAKAGNGTEVANEAKAKSGVEAEE